MIEVPVAGGHLTAWRSGSGRPALLLHGGPGLGDMHEDLAQELDGVYECVRFQQRGLPPSGAPGPYSIDVYIADAIAVLDTLGWATATAIGHSWGGLFAQHIAAARPDRLDALIGISTLGSGAPDGGWGDFDAEFGERIPAEVSAKVTELDAKLYRGEGSDEDIAAMLSITWPHYFADPDKAPPMPDAPTNQQVYADIHAEALTRFADGSLREGLRAFDKPALFVTGEADAASPEHPRATAELMSRGTFVLLPACGHFPWLETPGAVRAAVLRWLAEVA